MMQNTKDMRSPITGGKVSLCWEWRDMEFRKETFRVMFPYYRCEDSGEQFTTTESDGVWYAQLHNQYCRKYGIPYIDEIRAIRERYGVSALKMAAILGFGPNQWRMYEQEEIPSVSNGRMIRSIMNPKVFLDMVESAREMLTEKEYLKITQRVKDIIASSSNYHIEQYEVERVFATTRGEQNGYGQLSLERLKNVMLYVLEHCQEVWCTKMNKLLFYIDFLSYRERGVAMTGLCYRAIDFGPVPERWERVYSQFDEIRQEVRTIGEYEGIILQSDQAADTSIFSEDELYVLQTVCERLGECSSRSLSCMSHEETAWQIYHAMHEIIPYFEAFYLKGL